MIRTEPIDELAPDVRSEVERVVRKLNGVAGPHRERPGGAVNAAADRLAHHLHQATRNNAPSLATSDHCRRQGERLAELIVELDEFHTTARSDLVAAVNLLGDLTTKIAADERRRSEERVVSERRRQLEREVERLAAAEDRNAEAERRRRLEDEARDRLAAKAGA